MQQANAVFITTILIISLGFWLKKKDIITEQNGKTISRFLMHTTFPALMFVSTSKVVLQPSLLLIPFLCIGYCLVMLGIAWFWFAKQPNAIRGLMLLAAGGINVGLFGFPLIEGLFGREGLLYAIMFDIGNMVIVFGVAYPLGKYFAPSNPQPITPMLLLKKVASLPPVMGMVAGLTVNLLDLPVHDTLFNALDVLAKGNKPLVLLLMGIYLSFELERRQLVLMGKVLLIRYVVGLLIVAGLYFMVPDDSLKRLVLMVCIALPMGMTILPFSDEMGYDSRTAGTLVNLSLLISFGLMWILVLAFGAGL